MGLTGSNLTVNFEPNTVERNGTAASQGRFSSAGGLAVLAGGTSVVNTTVTESTFDRNAGTDIQATSDADDGNAEFRLNMTGNTSNGLYLLEELQTAPGVSTFTLFDGGGNSPAQTTTGPLTSSATVLDITFP